MKVGDYVRMDNGCICKVLEYTDISDNDFYVNTDSPYNVVYKSWIVKSSPNIIDLIEVGDYVNGERVINIIKKHKYLEVSDEEIVIDEKDIRTIVTNEQFEEIEYKIGE